MLEQNHLTPSSCYRKEAVLTEETFDFLKDLVENIRDAPVASGQPEKKKRVRKPKAAVAGED